MKKILVAMSGGVDSAVTAVLLKNLGNTLEGITLVMCDESTNEAQEAKKLCETLGIPHRIIDCRTQFKESIMSYFANSYAMGETPNPCVECNPKIKLGVLCKIAGEEGFDAVATGHYAGCDYSEKYKRKVIMAAHDSKKDQSYVLWRLSPEQVQRLIFPLEQYKKEYTREIAEKNKLSVAQKKDSQDICFIKNSQYAEFVEEFLGKQFEEGDFVDENGNVLGRHKGIIRYTVGQRKGLGLSLPAPLYVKQKLPQENKVVLCAEEDLFTSKVKLRSINLQAFELSEGKSFCAFVKLRYSAKPSEATVCCQSDGSGELLFAQPQRAATPGQSAVFYDSDGVLLGGGIIC